MTDLEKHILRFIRSYRKRHWGNSPSLREITEGLGYPSGHTNVVQQPINRLVEQGALWKIGK